MWEKHENAQSVVQKGSPKDEEKGVKVKQKKLKIMLVPYTH